MNTLNERESIREILSKAFKIEYDGTISKEEVFKMNKIAENLVDRFEERIFKAILEKTPSIIQLERGLSDYKYKNNIKEASTYLNDDEYQEIFNTAVELVQKWKNLIHNK